MNPAPRQLDIFADSHDVMLRNDVLRAIEDRQSAEARHAVAALARAYPQDAHLSALELLVGALEDCDSVPLPDHDALARERSALLEDLTPAALQAYGTADGARWLRPLWRDLATRAATLPFRPDRPEDHSAALFLRAEDWPFAAAAVEGVESWRRIPAPLGWMLEARCASGALDHAWPLLAELAWLAPARLDQLLRRLDDPLLQRLHKTFGAEFDGDGGARDLVWFPAWLLTHRPALAPQLALAQPSPNEAPERALRLLLDLLALERQGRHHDLVQRRRTLRGLQRHLYDAYMATR